MRIAINGMGRIGRLLFRRLITREDIEIVAVNDIMNADQLAYLLKYDSIYGPFRHKLDQDGKTLHVDNKSVSILQQKDPSQLPWKAMGVDLVLECSGRFTSKALAHIHIEAGAKRVILSTTGTPEIPLYIYGYNHPEISDAETILSPGGCMTNCSTPVLDVLQQIGWESAQLHILHSYTSRQELIDTASKDFRRGRAAAESIIPVEIDLFASLDRLFPNHAGDITTISTRVPVANGALADFTVLLKEKVSAKEVNELFKSAAANKYKNIIDYTEDPIVSLDVKEDTHSCIVDGSLTSVAGRQLKLFAFFDNEYGYTSRIIDWMEVYRGML